MGKWMIFGVFCLVAVPLAAWAQTLVYRGGRSLGAAALPHDLSGITWLGGAAWRAVSDKGNDAPRLSIVLNPEDGSITAATVAGMGKIGGRALDFEGIAYDKRRRSYFVSEESTPAIHEVAEADLHPIAAYPTPVSFKQIRRNRGLESLALNAAGTRLYTANEEALRIDGAAATAANPTRVRIVEYAVQGDAPGAGVTELHQYVYQVDAIGQADGPGTSHGGESGLSDMAILPDGKLLMLERAVHYTHFLSWDIPLFRARIYLVNLATATPLADASRPISAPVNAHSSAPVVKTLLYQGNLFNMEGLCIGPPTHNGLSVMGISDNQRAATGGMIQNAVHAFEYVAP